jgi:hypothetical protein
MLQPYTKEYQDQEMVITDFAFPAINSLVSFLYSGKIKANQLCEELLLASEKYEIPGLKARCERALSSEINELNAVDTLIAGDFANSPRLKKAALRFVASNIRSVMETQAWQSRIRTNYELLDLIIREMVNDLYTMPVLYL